MSSLAASRYEALLHTDFCAFIHRAFVELNPQTQYLPNWHIEMMAAKLEAVRRGEITRLILNVPPRYLKSHTASISFPAWLLGHHPAKRIFCASHSKDFAEKLARDCRRLMTSGFYRSLFQTRLSDDRQAVADFETSTGGGRFSTSIEGGSTGRGGDLIIIDDPLQAADAYSDVRRNAVNEWYENTLYTRLNSKMAGAIIIIMQRLHANDLTAHVLKLDEWDVVSFPVTATEATDYRFDTIFGVRQIHRDEGNILHSERESQETIDKIRRSMGIGKISGPVSAESVAAGRDIRQAGVVFVIQGAALESGQNDSELGYGLQDRRGQ